MITRLLHGIVRWYMRGYLKRNGYDGLFRLTGYKDCQCQCFGNDAEVFMYQLISGHETTAKGAPKYHKLCNEYWHCTPGYKTLNEGRCCHIGPMSKETHDTLAEVIGICSGDETKDSARHDRIRPECWAIGNCSCCVDYTDACIPFDKPKIIPEHCPVLSKITKGKDD